MAEAQRQDAQQMLAAASERQAQQRELRGWYQELKTRAGQIRPGDDAGLARLADLQERIRLTEERLREQPTISTSTYYCNIGFASPIRVRFNCFCVSSPNRRRDLERIPRESNAIKHNHRPLSIVPISGKFHLR